MLARGQPRTITSRAEQERRATLTLNWLEQRLNIREATGRNDGPAVAAIIKAGGGLPATRPEYCGYTQAADQLAFKLPIPVGAGRAANWFVDPRRLVYYLGKVGALDSIRPGYLVGIWSPAQARICHVTRAKIAVKPIRAGRTPRGYYCLGGNEGSGTNAGFHLTFYPGTSIRASSNYF